MSTTAIIPHPTDQADQPRGITKTVRFEDHGQDFLEWDIENGKVIGCHPFQGSVWIGCFVRNQSIRKGSFLHILTKSERIQMTVKYPVAKVIPINKSYVLSRRKLAMTPGSEWVFFRDGDDLLKDRWSSCAIRIFSACLDEKGEMVLMAERCLPKKVKGIRIRRRVYYSELW